MSSIENFYVRNNITHQWVKKSSAGVLKKFTSQRAAKRYADKHLDKFTIVSLNTITKKFRWRGGDELCHIKNVMHVTLK